MLIFPPLLLSYQDVIFCFMSCCCSGKGFLLHNEWSILKERDLRTKKGKLIALTHSAILNPTVKAHEHQEPLSLPPLCLLIFSSINIFIGVQDVTHTQTSRKRVYNFVMNPFCLFSVWMNQITVSSDGFVKYLLRMSRIEMSYETKY